MNDSFHITSTQPEVATVPCTAGCYEVMSTNMVNSQGIDKTTLLNLCLPICYEVKSTNMVNSQGIDKTALLNLSLPICYEVKSTNMVNSQGIDKTTLLNLCLPICYISIVSHNECVQLCVHMLVCEYWNGTLCVNHNMCH